jgi:hypothetical protein
VLSERHLRVKSKLKRCKCRGRIGFKIPNAGLGNMDKFFSVILEMSPLSREVGTPMEKVEINTTDDSPAPTEEAPSISGAYELAIGLRASDEPALVQYWEQFGFSVEKSGTLSAGEASRLYGVNSGLRSIRLHNMVHDRGAIRLMVWDKPVNEGLGLSPLKVVGSRWGTMLSLDVFNVAIAKRQN